MDPTGISRDEFPKSLVEIINEEYPEVYFVKEEQKDEKGLIEKWMVVKVKESSEKTRHVKNNAKSKKCILCGQRNASYHDRILFNKKKPYKLNFT